MIRTARTPPVALAAVGLLLLALVLVIPVPSHPRIWIVLSNVAHAPVFAVLSLLILHWIRSRWNLAFGSAVAWAFAATIVLGAAVELVQGFIGRDASWGDVWTDALGAAVALGWIAHREPAEPVPVRRTGLAIALLAAGIALAPLASAVVAYGLRSLRMPTIAGFSLPSDLYFIELQSASARRAPLPPEWSRPDDTLSLALHLNEGEWPGVAFYEPSPDWRGHRSLKLDLTNPGRTPLDLTLRVHDLKHDQRHEDRFNRKLTVAPETRTVVTVLLKDIESAPLGRKLDLGRVAGMILFATGESARPGRQFFVTRIWLE